MVTKARALYAVSTFAPSPNESGGIVPTLIKATDVNEVRDP